MAYKDVDDKMKGVAKKKAKSYAKKKMRRANRLTAFICLVALIAGAVVGVYIYEYICRDDCFVLNGKKEHAVELNASDFVYHEDGVKIIEFGKDISDKVVSETNMTNLGDGKYTVDTATAGRYYIKYTVIIQVC